MNWLQKAEEIVRKIERYVGDEDGWKTTKTTKEVTVWWKSSPDWNGTLYKAESTVCADPETVFSYIDPTTPTGPRCQWDKAIQELQKTEAIDRNVSIVRIVTRNAFGGLISSRDFIDLVVNVRKDKFLATHSESIDYSPCPPTSDLVRGHNHPCAIICNKVPEDPDKTRVVAYIQTDLGGMLPQALVDNALPSNQVDFFTSLKAALRNDGRWKGPSEEINN